MLRAPGVCRVLLSVGALALCCGFSSFLGVVPVLIEGVAIVCTLPAPTFVKKQRVALLRSGGRKKRVCLKSLFCIGPTWDRFPSRGRRATEFRS